MFDPASQSLESLPTMAFALNRKASVVPITGHAIELACSNCNLRALCMPLGLSHQEFDRIDGVVSLRRKVKKGHLLFHNGEKFSSLFAIRSGFFKSYLASEDGHEQVTGFQMAGDVLGLGGIASDHHTGNAIALEDAEVCLLPFDRLEELARDIPSMQRHIHTILSREIVRENGIMLLLGSMRAEERLAAFLINLVDRLHARGFSQTELVLRMTREEIGSYLGLKLETVSRAFSKFSEDGWLDVDKRHIRILRSDLLRGLRSPQHGAHHSIQARHH